MYKSITTYNKGECELLGPISLFIQICMGASAIGILIWKRNYHEHPKRRWRVWFFDINKQILGAITIHTLNIALSVFRNSLGTVTSTNTQEDDQCDWYFLNLLLDTTIGIPILWVFLYIVEGTCRLLRIRNIESGNYFDMTTKKGPLYSAFFKQLGIFISSLMMMKGVIYIILNSFESFADWFADLVLNWADAWPNFQVFLVMFVWPVILNCFQYYCIDNIIKVPSSMDYSDNFVLEADEERECANNRNFYSCEEHQCIV